MGVLVTTEDFDKHALDALIASAVLLGADLKMGLFTGAPIISKTNVIADFTEPAYAGYARQLVVMGPVFRDPVAGISSLSASLTWQEAAAITAVTITGAFVTYGAGPALLGAYLFDTPQNLVDALSAFDTIFQWIQSSENPGLVRVIV